MNSLRVESGAFEREGRHTNTIDEARAFVPIPMLLLPRSVRTGQVPVISKPALNTPSSIVSHPVEATVPSEFELPFAVPLDSLCLNA